MHSFIPAFLSLILSTFTLALDAGDLGAAQVSQTGYEHPKNRLIVDTVQLERRQGNAGPLQSTLSGSSSSYRSPTYAIMSTSADSSTPSMSTTANSSSVSMATIASGTTVGTEQGAGAKAPATTTSTATASGTTIGTGQGAGAKAPSTSTASTSSSKGGAPMATGHWAAAGILAVGVGGLMI